MAKQKHRILAYYDALRDKFNSNPMSKEVTDTLVQIHQLCQDELSSMNRHPLNSGNGNSDKTYFSFTNGTKYSRPVNSDLYDSGNQTNNTSVDEKITKVDFFWENLKAGTITKQSAEDITASLYVISMEFCCCADLISRNSQKICGTYFEKLIGHIYSKHLNTPPSGQQYACELDGVSIKIPTDFIFNLGPNKAKFDVPVKTSTRERCVEVWAQQRILDGAYGSGRFLGLLTCITEAKMNSENKDATKWKVDDVCVPNQWTNYQLFIAQIKRAYYLDVPNRYAQLNDAFPKIHVKQFGEFFFEWESLLD